MRRLFKVLLPFSMLVIGGVTLMGSAEEEKKGIVTYAD